MHRRQHITRSTLQPITAQHITIHYSVAHNDFILSETHVLTTKIPIQTTRQTYERDHDRKEDHIQKFGNPAKTPTTRRNFSRPQIQCLRPRTEANGKDSEKNRRALSSGRFISRISDCQKTFQQRYFTHRRNATRKLQILRS